MVWQHNGTFYTILVMIQPTNRSEKTTKTGYKTHFGHYLIMPCEDVLHIIGVSSHGDKFETKVTKWQGLREPTQQVQLIMMTLL